MSIPIKEQLRGYYQACGHTVRDIPGFPHITEARQRNEAGTDTITIIWTEEEVAEKPDRKNEIRIEGDLNTLRVRYPHASFFFVAPSRAGWSLEFCRDLPALGVRFREDSLFLDAEFKSDVNSGASDIAKQLRGDANSALKKVVPQPFTVTHGRDGHETGGVDVVAWLAKQMAETEGTPLVVFLVGPAGMGKTYAFTELFRRLYDEFQEKKRRRQTAVRPLPITPKHLPRKAGNRFQDVMENFLSTEIARPLGQGGLHWMIDHGRLALLCDGLDEVLSSDDSFFDFLLDRITTPGGHGTLLVCVRDSLFNTCLGLRDFIVAAGNEVTVVQLAPWEQATKHVFAQRHFLGDTGKADQFIKQIQKMPQIRELSSTPFFCKMLADRFDEGRLTADLSISALCDDAVESMCKREYEKGLLKPAHINLPELRDLLENVASEMIETDFRGIPVGELREYARLHCPEGIGEAENAELVLRLTQLPFFTKSADGALVDFQHEIIGFFLLAKGLVKTLEKQPDYFCRYVDASGLLARGAFLSLFASLIRERGLVGHLWSFLAREIGAEAFRVILQVAILTEPSTLPEGLKSTGLQGRQLGGLHFQKLDLHGSQFGGADLSNTVFTECDLRDASFCGAILSETTFNLQAHDLQGLRVGLGPRLHSINIRNKHLSDPREIVTVLEGKEPPKGHTHPLPCPAALQARFLFQKFVWPNGIARRNELDLSGFCRGRRHEGSPDNMAILEVLCSNGYLARGDKPAPHVFRPHGSKYGEVVAYAKELSLSTGLRVALDEICGIAGCRHVPPASMTA